MANETTISRNTTMKITLKEIRAAIKIAIREATSIVQDNEDGSYQSKLSKNGFIPVKFGAGNQEKLISIAEKIRKMGDQAYVIWSTSIWVGGKKGGVGYYLYLHKDVASKYRPLLKNDAIKEVDASVVPVDPAIEKKTMDINLKTAPLKKNIEDIQKALDPFIKKKAELDKKIGELTARKMDVQKKIDDYEKDLPKTV